MTNFEQEFAKSAAQVQKIENDFIAWVHYMTQKEIKARNIDINADTETAGKWTITLWTETEKQFFDILENGKFAFTGAKEF